MDASATTPAVDAAPDALAPAAPRAAGRPRDPERDRAICMATNDLVAELGYDGFSMEDVATRAKVGKATIYRRWPSKAKLVIDSIALIKNHAGAIDTGTLDGDLDALVLASCSQQADYVRTVIHGMVSCIGRDPELLAAFHERITQPRIRSIEAIISRAKDRGEVDPSVDVPFVAAILPSMTLQHGILTGQVVDKDFLARMVDQVLKPLLLRASG